MSVEFEISDWIPASPNQIYDAWLDSDGHTNMTGTDAEVSNEVGGPFEAWDGYIFGTNLELDPFSRILQSWRTTEFEETDEDSVVEIMLKAQDNGTLVTIRHTKLPKNGMQYKQGWIDYYFSPMKEFFEAQE